MNIIEPAIEHADAGFVVRPNVYAFWSRDDESERARVVERLGYTDAGKRIYFDAQGHLKGIGSRVHNPDLARTLRRIARGGADVFYRGEMAEEIAADMRRGGALLSRSDLENYHTERTEPLWGEYRGHKIATNRPPGGGVMLIDNVLWSGAVIDDDAQDENTVAIRAFNDKVAADSRVECAMLPIADGLTFIRVK